MTTDASAVLGRSAGPAERQSPRAEIAQAWLRAEIGGLDPGAALDRMEQRDFDRGSRLLVSASPVLERIAGQLSGSGYCLLLADAQARIVDRRLGQPRFETVLDRLSAVPGTQYLEERTGTNAIATVHELRRGIKIVGDEHYIEAMKPYCCYGHPIVNPVSRRLEGILDITGGLADTTDLLGPFLMAAAKEIEERLYLGARATHHRLMAAFDAASPHDATPVLAIGDEIFLTNRSAALDLRTDDHVALQALARQGGIGAAPPRHRITLASGVQAEAVVAPVEGGRDGYVIRLLIDRAGAEVPGPTAPVPAAPARRQRTATLVLGEPGTGRTSHCLLLAAGHGPVPGDVIVLDALDENPWPSWRAGVDAAVATGRMLVLENIDLLPPELAARLKHGLSRADAPLCVATAGSRQATSGEVATLFTFFSDVVQLKPLTQRRHEIPSIVARLLAELSPENPRRASPRLLHALTAQAWTGNLHELKGVLRDAVAGSSGGALGVGDVPPAYRVAAPVHRTLIEGSEYDVITKVLTSCGGNKVHTARELGISRRTLYNKIRTLKIQV